MPEGEGLNEVVADKGYHSNQELVDLKAIGVRSYISEPDRGLTETGTVRFDRRDYPLRP